jgi:hypothetical protein
MAQEAILTLYCSALHCENIVHASDGGASNFDGDEEIRQRER